MGMEYPTLFTAGTGLFTQPDEYRPESVTIHEAGHQFWYGLVGNNEFEAAWLDEGFNSYTDSEVLWRVYGPRRATTDYARVPVDGVQAQERLVSRSHRVSPSGIRFLSQVRADPMAAPAGQADFTGRLDW